MTRTVSNFFLFLALRFFLFQSAFFSLTDSIATVATENRSVFLADIRRFSRRLGVNCTEWVT